MNFWRSKGTSPANVRVSISIKSSFGNFDKVASDSPRPASLLKSDRLEGDSPRPASLLEAGKARLIKESTSFQIKDSKIIDLRHEAIVKSKNAALESNFCMILVSMKSDNMFFQDPDEDRNDVSCANAIV